MPEEGDYRFDATGPVDVRLEVSAGLVEIVAGERPDIVVRVSPRSEKRAGDVTAARQTAVVLADGRLRVATPRHFVAFGPSDSVRVRIEVPAGSGVEGRISAGTLHARGVLGDVRVRIPAGDLDLEATADALVRVGAGDITIGAVSGRAELTAGTGAVRVDRMMSGVLKTSHGELVVGEATGDLEASNATGGITVGRAGASTSAKTTHGRIRVDSAASGTVRLEASYGTLEVGIPVGTAAWLDLTTRRGSVRNELAENQPAPPSGERVVEVRARNDWGDIVVRRVPAAEGPRS